MPNLKHIMKNKIRIVVKMKKILAQFASTSAMATTNTTIFINVIVLVSIFTKLPICVVNSHQKSNDAH